jgi:hypothetical protein
MSIPPPPDLGFDSIGSLLTLVKWLFILVDALLVLGIIYAFIRSLRYWPHFDTDTTPHRQVLSLRSVIIRERWQNILKKFNPTSQDSRHLAVIEADSLVDEVLKQLGFTGEHMADRLSRLNPQEVPTVERVWRAHRLRNDIVHAPGYVAAPESAQNALADYESFLTEIGILA